MKKYTLTGIIFIMVGFTAVANQVITHTTREKTGAIGHLQMTADKTKTLTRQPIVGGIALVGGIVLLVMGNKKN